MWCCRSAAFNSKPRQHKKRRRHVKRLQHERLHRAILQTLCRRCLAYCQRMATSTIQSNAVIVSAFICIFICTYSFKNRQQLQQLYGPFCPEVLFQDLRRNEIRGWWWWWCIRGIEEQLTYEIIEYFYYRGNLKIWSFNVSYVKCKNVAIWNSQKLVLNECRNTKFSCHFISYKHFLYFMTVCYLCSFAFDYKIIIDYKAGMVHYVSGWMRGMQVKLWNPLRTHAIPECLRGVFTRRYTNRRLPYLINMTIMTVMMFVIIYGIHISIDYFLTAWRVKRCFVVH